MTSAISGLDVPATSDGQGVCGDVAAVEPQHAGYGVPEGGLAVAPVAVGDDERLPRRPSRWRRGRRSSAVVDELPIPLEDQVQVVQPELPALVAGRDRGDLRDEVVGECSRATVRPFRRVVGRLRRAEQEAVRVRFLGEISSIGRDSLRVEVMFLESRLLTENP